MDAGYPHKGIDALFILQFLLRCRDIKGLKCAPFPAGIVWAVEWRWNRRCVNQRTKFFHIIVVVVSTVFPTLPFFFETRRCQ
jgi:hypothetical protein